MEKALDPEKWPEVTCISLATPEDAKKMEGILNEIFARIEALEKAVKEIPPHNWQGI